MIRYYLLIMLLPLFGNAQKFSAADIKQLKLYSSGMFSNDGQAKSDPLFIKTGLKLQPIWQKRKDGAWLFAEKTDTAASYQVLHFYLQDDSTLLIQFLDFKQASKGVQLSRDINQQSAIVLYDLALRNGCEVYLKKNKIGYTGTSSGKDCFIGQAGTEYVTVMMTITKNAIDWQQAGFDKDGNMLQSVHGGNYHFVKQVSH